LTDPIFEELTKFAGRALRKKTYTLGYCSLLLALLAACSGEQGTEAEPAPDPAASELQAPPIPQPPPQQDRAERERNKAIVASYMEVLGDPAAEQEYLADDYHLIRGEFHNLSYNADASELGDMSDEIRVAIPDRENELVELIGEGGTVVVQYQIRGTHKGNLFGVPATGKPIGIEAVAIFELADGKIKDGWFMSDEVRLLNQLGTIMPARADGKIIVPPTSVVTKSGDELLAEALANPVDSQEYRNKLKVNAYKAQHAPDGMYPVKENNRPYNRYVRSGFMHLAEFAKEPAKSEFPMRLAFPDRVDMIGTLIADGDKVAIRFLLTATNTRSLFGIPATNRPVGSWEVGIMTFNGDDWDLGWWFGDDLGLLTQLGGSPDYFALDESAE